VPGKAGAARNAKVVKQILSDPENMARLSGFAEARQYFDRFAQVAEMETLSASGYKSLSCARLL